jgi:hypothetical protein
MIYCILGFGEVDYLMGDRSKADRAFLKALKDAVRYGFKIEKRYAEILIKALATGRGFPFNLP